MIRFKKKTREEQIDYRTKSVFTELMSSTDFEFTELETIQILNNVRRLLHENLINKKSSIMEQNSINYQKVNEINNAMEFIE